jgi:colanic acid biosynthesis protein WcaH
MILPVKLYKKILDVMPILCVDIIVQNAHGEYLLIKRGNEPLKGQWWVIGGRVFKGETLQNSAKRKLFEEIGVRAHNLFLVGYYEDHFKINRFKTPTGEHSVSVLFLAIIDTDKHNIKLDDQSTHWRFSKKLPYRLLKKMKSAGFITK